MQVGEPSRTARAAAFHRAALQVLEHGRIFADPLALRILGEYADAVAREAERRPSGRGMRIFIAVRTRFAEDALAAAVERGVPQLVVLGAGLETTGSLARFRGRSSSPAGLEAPAPRRGWHPAAGGADVRSIGFERETLAEGLAAAGFDPSAWTFSPGLESCLSDRGSRILDPRLHCEPAERRARRVRLRRSSGLVVAGDARQS